MVQFVTHPWRYRSELLSIRQRLYPDHYPESGSREVVATSNLAAADVGDADPEGAGKQATAQERRRRRQIQKDAVAEIHAWIERGECPHLVESTSRLVAAALADEEMLEQQAERRARLRLQDGQGAASHETMKAELPDADASVVAAAYALAFAR